MRRSWTIGLITAIFAMGLAAGAALAGNPHGVHDVTVSISGNTVTASGKEAGHGSEAQVHIVLSADAACVNPGSNKPKAANKQSFGAEGDFPVQNGQANFSLTLTATFQPNCSPPMTVQFSNITVIDTTNNIQLYP
jgi:hypothetical protein